MKALKAHGFFSALELYEEAWADDNIPTSRSEMFVPIVDYLAKKGRVDEAFDNIHDLRSRGVQVDTDVYLPLFKHCQKTANTELCLRVLEDMHSLVCRSVDEHYVDRASRELHLIIK